MSYWVLERANLNEPVINMPHSRQWGRAHWNDIIGFTKFTLWLLFVMSIPAIVFLVLVAGFSFYLGVGFFISQMDGEGVKYLILNLVIGTLMVWLLIGLVQTSARLWNFLRRGLVG